jgi:ATP adenylyltransferase
VERLYTPWRRAFIEGATADSGCFLCTAPAADEDPDTLIVHRAERVFVILNRYPYNNGHLLVAPRAHKGRLDELDADETLEVMEAVRRMVAVLDGLMHPDAYNVGLNLGAAAGAGLPGHLHWHVVPRWHGDTNFMPVVAGTKVIAQSLDALYDLLHERLGAG